METPQVSIYYSYLVFIFTGSHKFPVLGNGDAKLLADKSVGLELTR